MGRSRYKFTEQSSPHLITATLNQWIPLFTRPATVNIILDSWRYLQIESSYKLYGFVILENHLHCIAQFRQLSKDIQVFKAYTAKQMIDYLETNQIDFLLNQFAFHKKRHKQQSQYQIWQEGSHPQWIQSEQMLRQKLDYIHFNPVKRGYVEKPEHWRYSSAASYQGNPGLIDIYTQWYKKPKLRIRSGSQTGVWGQYREASASRIVVWTKAIAC